MVLKQLTRQRNLAIFTMISALQVFECTFEKNFLSVFVDVLLADFSREIRSMIISTSFILPWIITFFMGPLVNKYGVYPVIGTAFALKVLLSGIAICIGHSRILFVGVFAVATRVLTECVCRQTPIVLADLVDEDKVVNMRDKTMSGLIMGSSAFFTKPGESIAPMLGWAIIHSGKSGPGLAHEIDKNVLFTVLVLGPFIIASLQLILWREYQLRGDYLKKIKDKIAEDGNFRDVEADTTKRPPSNGGLFPSSKDC